jgi:hypothetical protein
MRLTLPPSALGTVGTAQAGSGVVVRYARATASVVAARRLVAASRYAPM